MLLNKTYIALPIVFMLSIQACTKYAFPEIPGAFRNDQQVQDKYSQFIKQGVEKSLETGNLDAEQLIFTAKKYIGVPHCMGGTTATCMDCSGMLYAVFLENGVRLPHNSEEQARYGSMVASMDLLKKGDLVFFVKTYSTHRFITHSGIYLGNNEFIHTSSSQGVTISSLESEYWNGKFIFGTRVF
jgi:murein DD-endopeptidase / murein LD-carboxypeptidase